METEEVLFKSNHIVCSGSKYANGEKNDCTVLATANAFGIGYDEAHEICSNMFGRKPKKGIHMTGQLVNMISRGDTINGQSVKRIDNLINPSYTHKPVQFTVGEFRRAYLNGTYVILVNKHALVIKDGVVIDNISKKLKGSRRVVKNAFKVIGKPEKAEFGSQLEFDFE